jgi:hypothetical protein
MTLHSSGGGPHASRGTWAGSGAGIVTQGGRQPIVNVIRAVREAVETTGQPMYGHILPDGPPGGGKIIR